MEHVYVVDDDPAIRVIVCELLEDEGFVVDVLGDGVGLLERLRGAPEPMVVLLDLRMPRVGGAELLAAVAAEPSLAARHRYVVMTGAGWEVLQALSALLLQLRVPVVEKPFACDALLGAVEVAARELASMQQ